MPEWQKPIAGLLFMPVVVLLSPLLIIWGVGMTFYYMCDTLLTD